MKQYVLLILFTGLIHVFGFSQTFYEEYPFQGKIGPSTIDLTFLEPDHFFDRFQGFYISDKKVRHDFVGDEMVLDGEIILTESIDDIPAGYLVFYDLDYSKSIVKGTWFNIDHTISFEFTLYKKES
jgi:hypothetical protein